MRSTLSVGEIIRSHHERYDGNGYPDQLVGDSIPWLARLLGFPTLAMPLRSCQELPHRRRQQHGWISSAVCSQYAARTPTTRRSAVPGREEVVFSTPLISRVSVREDDRRGTTPPRRVDGGR